MSSLTLFFRLEKKCDCWCYSPRTFFTTLLAFIIIPLVLLTKNESVMGKYKLGKATIMLALATVMITSLLFVISLISLL